MNITTDFAITLFWVVLTLTTATMAAVALSCLVTLVVHNAKALYIKSTNSKPKNKFLQEIFWDPLLATGYISLVVEREIYKSVLKTDFEEIPNHLAHKNPMRLTLVTGVWFILCIGTIAYLASAYLALWWWALYFLLMY